MSEKIRLWRLVKAGRVASAWDGEGSFRYGGRWNSRGQRVVYASSSLSLALLEVLVHLKSPNTLPAMVALSLPVKATDIMEITAPNDGAENLRFPYSIEESRRIGDEWIAAQTSPVLAVPSAIVPLEGNFLINPAHRRFEQITPDPPLPFSLDARLAR